MNDARTLLRSLSRLANARIHLGITGSVSCYKSCDLVRDLQHASVHVSATLTEAASKFVSPLLFESLGAMPVYGGMFAAGTDPFAHLEPGQHAAAFFIVPASASSVARIAHGMASDMLSAQALAFSGPMLIAPAMNPRMWENPAFQENLETLRRRKYTIVAPGEGRMACGDTGKGRLAPQSHLLLHALRSIAPQDYAGQTVLVTLGPTREPWDGVRFWSNPSSGIMGTALSLAAWMRGATVHAVAGPGISTELLPADLPGLVRHDVTTAAQMHAEASALWPACTCGMFSAAVADFSPVPRGPEKFKKADAPDGFAVSFTPNRDILADLSASRAQSQKVLGFAAETAPSMEALLELAERKRARKDCSMLAANIVGGRDAGFGSATNTMAVTTCCGRREVWPNMSKADVAWDLCTWLLNC